MSTELIERLRRIANRPTCSCPDSVTEAADEIERLRALYDAQCGCTDEWAEKYRAEVERKADAALLARVAELEQALASVNARLAMAQDAIGSAR